MVFNEVVFVGIFEVDEVVVVWSIDVNFLIFYFFYIVEVVFFIGWLIFFVFIVFWFVIVLLVM